MQIKMGSIVVEAAGKLGGHQVQRGRFSTHLVTKKSGQGKKKRQPGYQQLLHRQACSSWQAETPQYRKDFSEYWDKGIETTNRLNYATSLNGFQVYVMRYLNYIYANVPWNNAILPPELDILPRITGVNGGYGETQMYYAFWHTEIDLPYVALVKFKGYNKGQKVPQLSEMQRLTHGFPGAREDRSYFPKVNNKDFSLALEKDFIRIAMTGIDSAGVRYIEDFGTIDTSLV